MGISETSLDHVAASMAKQTEKPASAESERLREAAQQFEALLIGQMLKSARAESDSSEDQSLQPIRDMAEEQIASVLAAQGGLGLARIVSEQIPIASDLS